MIYMILLIVTTTGQPIERAYEFKNETDCLMAVDQVMNAYMKKDQRPVVFCSPNPLPYNPGAPKAIEIPSPSNLKKGGNT